jgi:hypothetical protein
MGGRKDGWRNGWIGGQREKVRGVYGFSSLMKQNKKGKNCAVFCFAGKRNYYIYIYAVITWEFFINGPVTTTVPRRGENFEDLGAAKTLQDQARP